MVRLGEVASLVTKGSTPTSYGHDYQVSGIPFVRVENLKHNTIATESISVFIDDAANETLKRSRLCSGDLLLSIAGTIGKVARVKPSDLPANTNQALAIIRGLDSVFVDDFACHALQDVAISRQLRDESRGGALQNVSLENVRNIKLPLPPLNEQRRIVARIDELTARSKSAREALQAIPPLLEKFRQSVLAAAFRGDLTAEWRRKNPDVEPAEVLLERIRVERRRRWEESGARGKYVEPEPVDAIGLPELPRGWRWASVSQLGNVQLGRQRSPNNHSGSNMVPYLRAANISWKGLILDDVKQMHFSPSEVERFRLRYGDILLGEASGSPGEVGKPGVWLDQLELCCFQNTLIRVRPVWPELTDFLRFHFLKDAKLGHFALHSKGTGIHHLGAAKMEKWPVALAPPREQRCITMHLIERLRTIEQLAETFSSVLQSQECLDQAILAKAFRGELVPQDPNDEPANVLLERLRAQQPVPAQKRKRK